MTKSKVTAIIATAILLIVGLGCSRLAMPGRSNLFEGDGAVKAAAAIKEKIGASVVNVIRLSVKLDEMEMTVQSPSNPKNIDKYVFENGKVTGPEPVQVFSFGENEMTADKYPSSPIDEIGFAAIPDTIQRAIALSKLENAKVELVSMDAQGVEQGTPNLKEEREKERGTLDSEIKEKRKACFKERSRIGDCMRELKPLEDRVQQLRFGHTVGRAKLVLTWRIFVEGPRGRKNFWADTSGKLNEKSF